MSGKRSRDRRKHRLKNDKTEREEDWAEKAREETGNRNQMTAQGGVEGEEGEGGGGGGGGGGGIRQPRPHFGGFGVQTD